ncbi:polysaccharide deacetylase family protein [Marinobacter sp. JSM 1782161]|uniref:polysaccharide deacetylase family protein n=1 Tax=Marinobacter sp. JSM 1782161 TaxID=2685906 RepID=UPI002B1BD5D9|nr:polysaccharide deacetylase family protein [Marinobacter sp. JSM 1782161]
MKAIPSVIRSPLMTGLLLTVSLPAAADLAVLQYHHVSDDTPAATSTTPALFDQQLELIDTLSLPVEPLRTATEHALSGQMGADPAVAITFDDAYTSVYTTAAPKLLERDWPFTVFVNTDAINEGRHGYMTWDQLKELASHPQVTIANHSADHGHLVRKLDESEEHWQQRAAASLDQAQSTLASKLGTDAPLFAYPYGEFDENLEALIQARDWYGYGQHSGAVGESSGATRLPRFPMANAYGQMEGLKDKLLSRALPVDANTLPDGRLPENPPTLALDLPESLRASALTCFGSGVGQLDVEPTGNGNRVTITADQPFNSRRFRYNCTYPAGEGRYYWQSVQWLDRSQPED